jgi:branched-subunit amino acid transport protein
VNSGWVVLIVVSLGTFALKSSGPLLLGNRELPERLRSVFSVLPAPLLAALVITATFAKAGTLVVDARVVGVGAAMFALRARRGFVTVVIVAAIATALARQLGMS